MTKDQILNDLHYATEIARGGESAPLLGGPIGLMWGLLLCFVFAMQWAIMSGVIGLPQMSIMYLWLGFAVIGGVGSAILGRKIDSKDGAHSAANRVESYVWIMFAAMMGSLFVGIVLNQLLGNGDTRLFDLMVIIGFAGQGLAYGVVAKMSGLKWVHMASFAGFTASAICFSAYGQVSIYLIAAIASVFTIVIPSLISMKAEVSHG